MKIPEFKRSGIGIIAEFHGIPSGFPNQVFKELKSSDVWNTLQDHWKLYQKVHYARDDKQVEELREPEEECEASDKDDWQIDMPDGDEIDDIEEASVDDDSPHSRNRQRLSC
jgi:hypothetical protein